MNNILSKHLLLTSFCLPVDGILRRAFTISLGFSLLAPGGKNVLSVEKGWQAAAQAVEEGAPIDLGLPKRRAEWLLAGSAWSREPAGTVECAMRVDTQERRFLVAGDREDNGLGLARPLTFTSMPLVWSRAFGGKDLAENPIGKGAIKENGVVRLPNVTEKVGGALLEKTPACPGPMPSLHRQLTNLGTFDTAWLRKNWPGPPSDFDWSFFNLAQESQRRDTPFVGNETITLTHLHPDHEVLQSALPGLRMRLFLNTGSEDNPLWQEVETVADTVWLFPNQAAGLQLWHAICPTSDEKSSEICQAAALYESCEGPRKTLPELLLELRQAQEEEAVEDVPVEEAPAKDVPAEVPEAGAPMPEVEVPNIPQPVMPPLPEDVSLPNDPVELLDKVMEGAQEEVSKVLEEVNPVLVEKGYEPLTPEQVLAQMDKQHKAMKQALSMPELTDKEMFQKAGLSQQTYDNIMKAIELVPPQRASYTDMADYEAALQAYGDEFAALTGASPEVRDQLLSEVRVIDEMQTNPDAADSLLPEMPSLEEALAQAGLKNVDMSKLEAALTAIDNTSVGDAALMKSVEELGVALGIDPSILTDELAKQLGTMRSMTYKLPEMQSAIEEVFANFPEEQRHLPAFKQNIENLQPGMSFDLKSLARNSGITNEELLAAIAAIDLLPSDPPAPPEPDDTEQKKTMAQDDASADLDDAGEEETDEEIPESGTVADYTGQDLSGRSFAGLDLAFARFDKANLSHADFSRANLEGASFANADLSNADLSGANLKNVDFTGAGLEGANLSSCRANGATFARVTLGKTLFSSTNLRDATFTECAATDTDFSGCTLESAWFSRSVLDGARFAGARLAQADFTACSLVRADFTGADMRNARMLDNRLDFCVFFKAGAQDSSWQNCHGESQNLRKAELANATFDDCSLVRSDLGAVGARECRFQSCDLHGANLRLADLLNGALRDCKLGGADLRWASLFACDLLYSAVNEETNIEGANIERTRLAQGDL